MGSFLQKVVSAVPKPVRKFVSNALPQGFRNKIRRAVYHSESSGVIISNNGVKVNSKTGEPIKPTSQGVRSTKTEHSEAYNRAPNSILAQSEKTAAKSPNYDAYLMRQLANPDYR